jgi:hypothetical protein
MLTYKTPALADTINKPSKTPGSQTENAQMTTITILLLTAAIEAPLFYLRAIQRAEEAYLEMYNLKGNRP